MIHRELHDLDPIEYTHFGDKRVILRKCLGKPKRFGDGLEQIESPRNPLAHAGTYLSDDVGIEEFLNVLGVVKAYPIEFRGGQLLSNTAT